jgi:hypothetical protein
LNRHTAKPSFLSLFISEQQLTAVSFFCFIF